MQVDKVIELERPILVVAEDAADAELVAGLIKDDYSRIELVHQSQDPVEDFEAHQPGVLILAFPELEQAERYCLGLYRLSQRAKLLDHETLILCRVSELERVFRLCKQHYFDDYVLFWPMPHDAFRLHMALHLALERLRSRELGFTGAGGPLQQFEASSRQLREHSERLNQGLDASGQSLHDVAENAQRHADAGLRQLIEQTSEHLTSARDEGTSLQNLADQQFAKVQQLGERGKPRRPTVLVVEDDVFQQKLVQSILQTLDIELFFASTGAEAQMAVKRMVPHLVLMDLSLPDASGLDLIQAFRQRPELVKTVFLVLTGDGRVDTVRESRRRGAHGFVVKPFDQATLRSRVEEHLAAILADTPVANPAVPDAG